MSIDEATRARWRRMFDARTAGPWTREHGVGLEAISVTYNRSVGRFSYEEDAEMFCASYDGWPRTLDALEQSEVTERALRDEVERLTADRKEMAAQLTGLSRDYAVSYESALIHEQAARHARAAALESADACQRLASRVAELERMLDAWRKHRNSPLLIADHDNYQKRHQ